MTSTSAFRIYYGSDLADYIDHECNEGYERDWENWKPEGDRPLLEGLLEVAGPYRRISNAV